MTAPNDITFYLPSLNSGGIERLSLNLAAAWREREDLKITLLLDRLKGSLVSQIPDGVEVHEIGAGRTLQALPHLTRYLRERQPEVLLCGHNHNIVTAIWGRAISRSRTRIVISHHIPLSVHAENLQHWQYKIMPSLARMFFRFADAQIAVSKAVADDISGITGIDATAFHVIYNPVNPGNLSQLIEQRCPHPWLQGDDDRSETIISIGRLTAQKDYPTLFRAFKNLRQSRNVRLIILGEGEDREALQGQLDEMGISQYVDLVGFKENPFAYLNRAQLFVLSSAWEGFGNVLVEAMACGTPVVSTDCPGGPSEVLGEGRFGRLVPVGDEQALAAAMEETLAQPTDANLLRQRAEDFAVDRIAEQYLRVLLPGSVRT